MVWAEKSHKDNLAPIPKLLEVINSKLLKVMNSKLLEVDSYLTVSLSEKKWDKWNIAFRLVQGRSLITEIKKKPAEAMLGLGVILAACGGLGMYWKIGMVGSDSFEEEQRKEIRIFIPIILFWLFGGKKSTLNESSTIIFEYHHDKQGRVNKDFVTDKLWQT